jgi:hypothetical protein
VSFDASSTSASPGAFSRGRAVGAAAEERLGAGCEDVVAVAGPAFALLHGRSHLLGVDFTVRRTSLENNVANHADKKEATKQNEYSIICAILNDWIFKKIVRSDESLKKTKIMGPTPAS